MPAKEINFSMFKSGDDKNFMGKVQEATAGGQIIKCGWLNWDDRTTAQNKAHDEIVSKMPVFGIRGRFSASERRYKLWEAYKSMTGKFLPYNWQQTGSCVGAGGGNMAKTAMSTEIAIKGEREMYKELWWLFTYGRSRTRSGIRGRGEGSSGSGYAEAATEDGYFEIDPAGHDLPDYKVQDGWLVQDASTEIQWSDGAKMPDWAMTLAKTHLFKTAARMKNKDDCFEAVANGYPLAQASSFGFRSTKIMGTKQPIRVATWNGHWDHQTYIDEVWDHPELNGIYFRWGNNWGPDAHGAPTGDEPPGGVYIHESLMDRLCKEGEVYAYSVFNGFPAREINFSMF
jgi:hypothetical protein